MNLSFQVLLITVLFDVALDIAVAILVQAATLSSCSDHLFLFTTSYSME